MEEEGDGGRKKRDVDAKTGDYVVVPVRAVHTFSSMPPPPVRFFFVGGGGEFGSISTGDLSFGTETRERERDGKCDSGREDKNKN